MNTPHTILVAVDFSTGSHAALVQAAHVAAFRSAALHVLHVVDSAAVATLADMQGGSYESHAVIAAQGAQAALERWMGQCGLNVEYHGTVAIGHPVHEILEHARMLNASLLVAGLQGAGQSCEGAGSVSAKLARKSTVPVLLVRPGQVQTFHKIVACVDFTPSSHQVIKTACLMARQHATGLECLHVWKEPWVVAFDPGAALTSAYPVIIFTQQEREAHVRHLQEDLRGHVGEAAPDVPCIEVLREARSHGSGIVDHAKECRADLVVIGSTGRGGLRGALLGTTAERLLNHCPCSVLVVRVTPEDGSGRPMARNGRFMPLHEGRPKEPSA